jgi:rhamnosyltransferase
MNKVTVLMRTFNNAEIIGQTLKALFSQNFKDFDLFVVDSGSTDGTLEILSHYNCYVKKIKSSEYHPGKVLNSCIDEIDSDIIVFLNSDTVLLNEKSLYILIKVFSDQSVGAAYGRQIARPDATTDVRRDYEYCFPYSSESPDCISLSLPISAIKKSVWKKNKFYTQSWGSEDTELGNRIKKSGLQVLYVPNAIAMHSHNYTPRQLFNRAKVEGEADFYIYKKSPSLLSFFKKYIYRNLRDLKTAWRYNSFKFLVNNIFYRNAISEWGYYQGVYFAYENQHTEQVLEVSYQ